MVIQMLHDSLTIKIVSVDEYGRGIASIQPQSLKDMIEVRLDIAVAHTHGAASIGTQRAPLSGPCYVGC